MNRRDVLKNLGLFTGGVLLFPSCDFSDEKVTIVLSKLQITPDQEELLKSIVDTIIPESEIPGGLTAKAHNFIWVFIDECRSEEDQEKFISDLNDFKEKSGRAFGKKFSGFDYDRRLQFVEKCMKTSKEASIYSLVSTVKNLSIWCYMNSEYILTKKMPYKLVPGSGSYKTCKTIDPNQKINKNA